MKRAASVFLAVVMLAAMLVVLAGCGGDGGGIPDGTWVDDWGDSMTVRGNNITMQGISLTYRIDGNWIVLTFQGESERYSFRRVSDREIVIDGDTLRRR